MIAQGLGRLLKDACVAVSGGEAVSVLSADLEFHGHALQSNLTRMRVRFDKFVASQSVGGQNRLPCSHFAVGARQVSDQSVGHPIVRRRYAHPVNER